MNLPNSISGLVKIFGGVTLLLSVVFALQPETQTLTYQDWSLVVSTFPLSWEDSRTFCRSIDRNLLSVDTNGKDRLLVDLFINGASGNVTLDGNAWISAKEIGEGIWNWNSTGEPLYYTRWFVGQPDDLTDFNCAYLAKSALLYWRDANCSAPMYFICE